MAAMAELEDRVARITMDEYGRWEKVVKGIKNITENFDDPDPPNFNQHPDTEYGYTQEGDPGLEALNEKGIKVCHLNVGGLGQKLKWVKEWLKQDKGAKAKISTDVVVFAITETKLKPEKTKKQKEKKEKDLEIPGYKYRRIDNQFRECPNGCGSQLIYFDESFQAEFFRMESRLWLDNSLKGWVECSIMKLEKQFKFIVCIFYVNPLITSNSKKILLFFDYFERIVKFLSEQSTRVFILGDFNIDLIEESLKKSYILKIADKFGFKQLQEKITRPSSETNLDHIYLRRPKPDTADYKWDRINVDKATGEELSDHCLTYISFSFDDFKT